MEGAISNGYKARIYPRDTGMRSSTQLSVHCLTCCTAAHLKRGPNVALSSPRSAAIECFLARLGKRSHPPLSQLGKHPRKTKATTPWQANRDLDSNPCTVVCVSTTFPVCRSAVTSKTVYSATRLHFHFTSLGLELCFGSFNKLKIGGRAGPIASTGGSRRPGLQPREHCDACARCISGMLRPLRKQDLPTGWE